MKQIKNFNISRLLASACVEFHTSVVKMISVMASIVRSLGDLFPEYKQSTDDLLQAAGRNPSLVNTRKLTETDKARDAYVIRLFKSIKDLMRSPTAWEKEKAELIWDAISQYEGLTGYEMNKQTGVVRNLLAALGATEINAAITALRLDLLVRQIGDSNFEFAAEMNVRIEGEAEKMKITAREQSRLTNKVYAQVVQMINATAVVSPTADTDELIDKMNALIEEYQRVIKNMRPGGSGNEKRKKKEEDTPETTTPNP